MSDKNVSIFRITKEKRVNWRTEHKCDLYRLDTHTHTHTRRSASADQSMFNYFVAESLHDDDATVGGGQSHSCSGRIVQPTIVREEN